MGKIIEGLWDCPFYGNKRIRAGQKPCPDCGHPQDENTKFYMPDEIKYVSEEEAEKISRNPFIPTKRAIPETFDYLSHTDSPLLFPQ